MAAIGVVDGIAGAPCRGSQAVPDKEHLDGLRSGEYLGRKKSFEPTAWMAARTTFGAVRSQIEGSVQNLSHFWAAVDPVDTNSQWVRLTRGIPEARADMILTVANEGRFAMAASVGLRGDYLVAREEFGYRWDRGTIWLERVIDFAGKAGLGWGF